MSFDRSIVLDHLTGDIYLVGVSDRGENDREDKEDCRGLIGVTPYWKYKFIRSFNFIWPQYCWELFRTLCLCHTWKNRILVCHLSVAWKKTGRRCWWSGRRCTKSPCWVQVRARIVKEVLEVLELIFMFYYDVLITTAFMISEIHSILFLVKWKNLSLQQ